MEGRAKRSRRFGISFGYRFFLFLLIGLIWLVPAYGDARFVYAMLGWDLLVILAWVVDLRSLPKPPALLIRRTWLGPPALAVQSPVKITAINESGSPLRLNILDAISPSLRNQPAQIELTIGPGKESDAE